MATGKRATKRARAQVSHTVRRRGEDFIDAAANNAGTVERQAERAMLSAGREQTARAAANTNMVVNALVSAGHHYMTCVNRLGDETMKLGGERYRHNLEFASALARCSWWTEAVWLHREWVLQAAEDYIGRGCNLALTAASAAIGPRQTAERSSG